MNVELLMQNKIKSDKVSRYEEWCHVEELPERHLECSGCKKPIRVVYTEIVGKNITNTSMCNDCPFLREKLRGQSVLRTQQISSQAEVVCGGCGLTLDLIKMGSPLGCSLCYEIFGDELIQELSLSERIAIKSTPIKKGVCLHTGRRPGQKAEQIPSIRLYALHEALSETLGREEYEEAALLRDQIREITQGGNLEEAAGDRPGDNRENHSKKSKNGQEDSLS